MCISNQSVRTGRRSFKTLMSKYNDGKVMKRLVALVKPTDIHPPSRHLRGMPEFLAVGDEASIEMPWPRLLIIAPTARGYLLDRLTSDGESAGDTWHQDLDEAREQALDEYAGALGEW